MKTTETLLKLGKQQLPNGKLNVIASYVASLFSIIFSMSIIKETTHFVKEWYIVALLIIFIVLFLVFNEYRKVIELRSRFANCKSSLFIVILTFIISFSLSGIGIYLWTNKTLESEVKNDKINVSERLLIENRYNILIDSISSLKIEENVEFKQLNRDIEYWKSRSAANLEERAYIRTQIERTQQQLNGFITQFNQSIQDKIKRYENQKQVELANVVVEYKNNERFISRANKISLIFFIMVIITELIIILLAKEYANNNQKIKSIAKGKLQKDFVQQYRAITDILMRKNKINFDDILFSPYFNFSRGEEKRTKEVKAIYYLFGDLKILELPLKEAQERLKEYYETIINL